MLVRAPAERIRSMAESFARGRVPLARDGMTVKVELARSEAANAYANGYAAALMELVRMTGGAR
jgi:hypothetical protein